MYIPGGLIFVQLVQYESILPFRGAMDDIVDRPFFLPGEIDQRALFLLKFPGGCGVCFQFDKRQ